MFKDLSSPGLTRFGRVAIGRLGPDMPRIMAIIRDSMLSPRAYMGSLMERVLAEGLAKKEGEGCFALPFI
jgi:hypothetical protein